MLTKKLAKQLLSINGFVKGVVFDTDAEWIKLNYGSDGLRRVEEKLRKIGYPIKYEKIIAIKDYPVGFRAISLLAIKDVFKLSDNDIINIGEAAVKTSLLLRLVLKYFISTSKALSKAPELWSKHYSIGKLVVKEVSEKNKRVIVDLIGVKIHPIICTYLMGYFRGYVQLTRAKDKVKVKLVKCIHNGDKLNRYVFTW